MKRSSVLTIALIVAVAGWLVSLGLFWHLSQYDPYSWASPGVESVQSRNLYLERRALYVWVGVFSFLAACVLGLLKLWFGRRRRDVLAAS
jgi:Zn-dependent protease with chaperone function